MRQAAVFLFLLEVCSVSSMAAATHGDQIALQFDGFCGLVEVLAGDWTAAPLVELSDGDLMRLTILPAVDAKAIGRIEECYFHYHREQRLAFRLTPLSAGYAVSVNGDVRALILQKGCDVKGAAGKYAEVQSVTLDCTVGDPEAEGLQGFADLRFLCISDVASEEMLPRLFGIASCEFFTTLSPLGLRGPFRAKWNELQRNSPSIKYVDKLLVADRAEMAFKSRNLLGLHMYVDAMSPEIVRSLPPSLCSLFIQGALKMEPEAVMEAVAGLVGLEHLCIRFDSSEGPARTISVDGARFPRLRSFSLCQMLSVPIFPEETHARPTLQVCVMNSTAMKMLSYVQFANVGVDLHWMEDVNVRALFLIGVACYGADAPNKIVAAPVIIANYDSKLDGYVSQLIRTKARTYCFRGVSGLEWPLEVADLVLLSSAADLKNTAANIDKSPSVKSVVLCRAYSGLSEKIPDFREGIYVTAVTCGAAKSAQGKAARSFAIDESCLIDPRMYEFFNFGLVGLFALNWHADERLAKP